MGDLTEACRYYDRVLAYYEAHHSSNVQENRAHAEAHLLFSKALFELGNFEDASQKIIKAQELLDKIETDNVNDKEELECLKQTRKSIEFQHIKLLLNRGEYEQALEGYIRILISDESDDDSDEEKQDADDADDGNLGYKLHHALKMFGALEAWAEDEVDADVLDFRHQYALTLLKNDEWKEAKNVFNINLSQTEKETDATKVRAFS